MLRRVLCRVVVLAGRQCASSVPCASDRATRCRAGMVFDGARDLRRQDHRHRHAQGARFRETFWLKGTGKMIELKLTGTWEDISGDLQVLMPTQNKLDSMSLQELLV